MRERELINLVRKRKRPTVLLIDKAQALFKRTLGVDRSREITKQMLAAGLPV